MAPGSSSASSSNTPISESVVLDFEPSEANQVAVTQTRRLLGQVLTAQGPEGLAKALHVAASKACSLKHRVACVTCRSRLDPLVTALVSRAGPATPKNIESEELVPASPPKTVGPLPLSAWLVADAGRGLAPAPRALRDLGSLAAFLAAFGCGSGTGAAGEDIESDLVGRRAAGRSSAVVRCQYHAQNSSGCGFRCGCCNPRAKGPKRGGLSGLMSGSCPPLSEAWALAALPPELVPAPDKERFIGTLLGGTTEAEWRQLGTIDVDTSMGDLFAWLEDRGLCAACVDVVAALLIEIRSMATVKCNCGRCRASAEKAKKVAPAPLSLMKPRLPGEPPSVLRVQGRLRAICGIYRLQPQTLNGRAVYKKDFAESYLLYTSLKDWMFSGRPDAGGTRCEGWAYVTDPAESPDEACGVWKVSGSRGWEEDISLVVSSFEGLTQELQGFRGELGLNDTSSVLTSKLCQDNGLLVIHIQDPEVLAEILWAPEEPPPVRNKTGGCAHIATADAAKFELRCWLRWLIRDRLDAQRRRVLAQGQVGMALCKLFACAALQQLEEASETPPTKKKGRCKKSSKAEEQVCAAVEAAPISEPVEASIASKSQLTGPAACTGEATGSDGSASTRASSEEPPDAQKAQLALGARRLMEKMGWRPKASEAHGLAGDEVAEWREQHPSYRQTIQEERQRLRTQFAKWVSAR